MPLYAGELNIRRGAPLAEFPAPMSEVLRAQSEETQLHNPMQALRRMIGLTDAERGEVLPPESDFDTEVRRAPVTRLDAETARSRVKDEGLKLTIPDEGISEKALDILIRRKREEMQRQDIFSRGPSGIGPGAARLGTALVESLFDPLNIASAFVPVVGPARYTAMLARAGSPLARAGVRAGVGATEGAVGAAILEPLIYSAAQAEQLDYTMYDSLLNIGFGGVFGGGLHAGAGAVRDIAQPGWWRITDRNPDEAAAIAQRVEPETRETALRTAVAQAVDGRFTEVEAIVRSDPASVTVYHGSPHKFDKFDMSKVGSGEGAQAFGHGLYFAENPKVAEAYSYVGEPAYAGRLVKHYVDDALKKAESDGLSGADAVAKAKSDLLEQAKSAPDYARQFYHDAYNNFDMLKSGMGGNLYRVELPREAVGRMLDWDKPLREQPESVKKAFNKLVASRVSTREIGKDLVDVMIDGSAVGAFPKSKAGDVLANIADHVPLKGELLYRYFGDSPESASAALHGLGIPGIRYLDQGSRTAGDGTRNIVLFDHNLATIVERNGEPLTPQQVKEAAQKNAGTSRSAEPEAAVIADRTQPEAAKPVDLKAAEESFEQSVSDAEAFAEARGVDLKQKLTPYAEAIQRTEDYAKALRVAAACGLG